MGSKARPAQLSAQGWFERGVRAGRAGDLDLAERAYRNAIDIHADYAQAHTNLGTVLQLQGRLQEAEQEYRTATVVDPDSANAHANLGSLTCALGQLDEAEACYRRALELEPSAAHNHSGLGTVLHAQGRYVDAAASLRDAISLAPTWAEPRQVLALVLFRSAEYAPAVDACLAALALSSEHATTRSVLGLALARLGHLEAAAGELTRAAQLETGSSTAQFNLGIILDRLNRQQQAAAAYAEAVRLDPTNLRAQLNLAGAMMRLGRRDEAIAGYRAVLALDPEEPTALHLVSALTGETTETAPTGYVRALFDDTAADFERHLRALGYGAPEVIARVVERTAGSTLARVVDLGCGTGMVGAGLRALSTELHGVDVSPGMLEQARRRRDYDYLHQSDVVAFLRDSELRFDAATAGDVLIYLGDLAPLFTALQASLRPGGIFVFSVEVGQGGWQLTPTGRYSHGDAYVVAIAQEHGFDVVSHDDIMLRHEHGEPVEGRVFSVRLRELTA